MEQIQGFIFLSPDALYSSDMQGHDYVHLWPIQFC